MGKELEKAILPPLSPLPTTKRSKSSIGTGFLENRLSSFSLTRRGTGPESSEDIRGPLGLNLLHEPSEPLIDFIFVHGLRGGSRKTWSLTDNIGHYWPKEWLPVDPKFKNVRVHSFGYNSDWGEKAGSILTIHDFGQALLGDMFTSPHMNTVGHETPLVMVGHSMGGVVIKKAFLLAKQDPQYHSLARRFHSMFFLATPHRGADSAQLLRNMIKLSVLHSEKAYVADLIPNSGAIQVINDEFRHAYQGVHLWSFFETLFTSLGLIVEKDSAIIGLPGERIQLMNADHRHVCKFNDPADNNYRTLRNAFASTIETIETTQLSARKEEERSQMRRLSQYLSGADKPETDLVAILEKRVPGSCQWINAKLSFQDWEDGFDDAPKCYWLRGEPATGKSTIVAHIIDYLEQRSRECSFFFFKHGDATRSTVASMLLSIAWQMASLHTTIREALTKLYLDDEILDRCDERSIWQKLFMAHIFDVKLKHTQYWIIDALDECSNQSVWFPLLAKIPAQFPLRILMSSRPYVTLERLFTQERICTTVEDIERENSMSDIRIFLEARSHYLPVQTETARCDLINQILEKSNGNFLWTSLTLRELETANSEEQILEVLETVPEGMDDVYDRILSRIMATPRNIELAKAILRWVVCAARPLLVEELKEAIKLDIRETPHNLEKDAGTICGHMVYVDNKQRVQVAHQTVRAYLVRDGLSSDFAIDRPQTHSRLAEVCLKYLCGDEMKAPRHRRGSTTSRILKRSAFSTYALMQFSEHVARASSAIDAPFIALHSFLRGNVLSWMEIIAVAQKLSPLTQTAKNIKIYLKRRAKYRSPLGQEVSHVSAWASDIIHIVARFGKPLLMHPSSIQFLIPSVCPSESIIHKTFKDYPRSLNLVGLSQKEWNDQLTCIIYPRTQAYCMASCANRFAVGISDGSVRVYHETTCQEILQLIHGEGVRFLALSRSGTHLAAAGRKKIKMWDLVTSKILWTFTAPDILLAIEFDSNGTFLMITTRTEFMISLQVADGEEADRVQFSDIFEDDQINEDHKQRPSKLASSYRRPPNLTVFSTELNLLAVGYRARPVTFWDLNDCTYVGQLWRTSDEFQLPVIALAFNSNVDINLVAAAYQDGSILTFDPWTQQRCGDTGPVGALTLGVSPDGTVLATADFAGTITLFDFETLRQLYKITSLEQSVRRVMFNSSGLRFYDVRGDRCSVWEPAILVRRNNVGDDSSLDFSEEIPSAPEIAANRTLDEQLALTALVAHHDGDTIICGRENGNVTAYSSKTGQPFQELFGHRTKIGIFLLEWNETATLLTSVDRASNITLRKISMNASRRFDVADPTVNYRSASPAHQVLTSIDGKRLLVSTSAADEIWDLESGSLACSNTITKAKAAWKWINHPSYRDRLLLVSGDGFRIFDWSSFCELSSSEGILLAPPADIDVSTVHVVLSPRVQNLCIARTAPKTSSSSATDLRLWPMKTISLETKSIDYLTSYDELAKDIKTIIGCYRSQLLFLDHSGWVCSVDIDNINVAQKSFTRHFFIPFQLQGIAGHLLMAVTSRGAIALGVGDELAVFHSGLDFKEEVGLGGTPLVSAKPSMRSNLKRFSSAPT
ncbi:MAG: hypothetical protein Q9195_006083 [Heterodermia aff. obscurata]